MLTHFPSLFSNTTQTQPTLPRVPWLDLVSKSLENTVKLAELNVWLMKESAELSQRMLAAQTPSELFAASAQALPHLEKTLTYANQVAGIGAEMQADLSKVSQTGDSTPAKAIEQAPQPFSANSNAGPGNLFAVMNSAIENASAGYVQWVNMAKQAGGAMGLPVPDLGEQHASARRAVAERSRKLNSPV